MVKIVELINRWKFAKALLDGNNNNFVDQIAALKASRLAMSTEFSWTLLLAVRQQENRLSIHTSLESQIDRY